MAWKRTSTTLSERDYSRKAGELFEYFQKELVSGKKDHLQIVDNGNFMNLDSSARNRFGLYGEKGMRVEVEFDLDETSFSSFCSALPKVLSGIDTYSSKRKHRNVELNLGRVAKEKTGEENIGYMLHAAYTGAGIYQVSVILPQSVRRKLKKYGSCSAVDSTLPEAEKAILIRDAALEEGFEPTKDIYKCVTPVCPRPMKLDDKELAEFIKASPWITMEGDYWEKVGRINSDSEFVFIEANPKHISIEGISSGYPYKCADFTSKRLIQPVIESTGIEFGGDSGLDLNETYRGFLELGYEKLENKMGGDQGLVGRAVREGRSTIEFGKLLALAPFAAMGLLVNSAYSVTIEPLVRDRRERKAYIEYALTKGGVERPNDRECIAVANLTCLNEKYEEKKKSGNEPKEE